MRPIPVPDELVFPDGRRAVISPPDGDLTNERISPAEAVILDNPGAASTYTFVIQLEDGELEAIVAAGGRFFYTTIGVVAPFQFNTIYRA